MAAIVDWKRKNKEFVNLFKGECLMWKSTACEGGFI